jgi:ATP-dependent Clp protease protease subunit
MSTYQHERVLYVVGPLTTESVAPLVLQLLALNDDSGEPIHLYLTSPGGDALAALALIDVIRHIATPVHTYALGLSASAALYVVAAGEPGFRYALPNSWFMAHGGTTSTEGRLNELQARAGHYRQVDDSLTRVLAATTKHNVSYWRKRCLTETWFSAQEALAAGIVDQVLSPESGRSK